MLNTINIDLLLNFSLQSYFDFQSLFYYQSNFDLRLNFEFIEFETSVKTFRTNPVTREKEPYLPTWSKALRFAATGSAVFFMVNTHTFSTFILYPSPSKLRFF